MIPKNETVIVHDLDQALAAAEATVVCGRSLTLASPPGAADRLGAEVFVQLMWAVRERLPDAQLNWVLDCGDAPGLALAAFRAGAPAVALNGPTAVIEKVQALAEAQGARVTAVPEDALDLAGEADAKARVMALLSAG